MDFFFLAILFIIGVIVTYEDIKIGKVRNRFILAGFISGLVAYLVLLVTALFIAGPSLVYFKNVLVNILLSSLISFSIWYFGFWSAGDAKLFMLFSFLIPLKFYGDRLPISFFPSFALLVNIFIFVLIFVVLGVVIRIITRLFNVNIGSVESRKKLRKTILEWSIKINNNKLTYINNILSYCWLFLLFYILRMKLGLILTGIWSILNRFSFIIMFLAFRPLRDFLKKIHSSMPYFSISLLSIYFVVSIIFTGHLLFMEDIFINFSLFMIIFIGVRGLLMFYIGKKDEVVVSIDKVAKNAVLATESIKKINESCRQEGTKMRFYSDGLTNDQINYLKTLSSKKPEFSKLRIYKTFPFAPFIFAGTLITVLFRGIVLHYPFAVAVLKAFKK